ncbi:hypothetical protein [Tenacibaculum aiptasiae]|uniref:hypothetical protein n=1 Tax=Tenacibaculum aiptasiae TaxID=426481 RepID=UPI00232D3605|nr:hypothetical protein [Tenacibaculum aiptasiae]
MSIKINDQFHVSTHKIIADAVTKVLIEPNKTNTKCDPKSGTTLDRGHTCWYPAFGSTIEINNVTYEELMRWSEFVHVIKPHLNQVLKDEFEKGKKHGVDLLNQLNKGEITLNDITF